MGDLTGNGMPDIVTANACEQHRQRAHGQWQRHVPSRSKLTPSASRPYSVAVADLTGDGEPDIVTTDYGGNSVSVLLNNGDGTFASQQTFSHRPVSRSRLVVADVNGDGRPDLVDRQQSRQRDRRASGQG